MKKKILLPTDFSKNAWAALKYASELYKNERVEFYLLHAFSVQSYSLDKMMGIKQGDTRYDEAKAESEAALKKQLEHIEILDTPQRHTYFTRSLHNSPVEAVKDFVEEKDIDLVIISNKGETNAANVLMGSNSIDIMEKVRNCPVFLVPAGVEFKEPNEIVFPTSFKTHFKRKELSHLYEISRITNAPVRVLHVSKKELTKEQLNKKALLEECFDGLTFTYHFLENDDVQTGLNLFTASRGSEMIAFINKKHAFFNSVFSKPMVKELGFNAKVPVLTLHDLKN